MHTQKNARIVTNVQSIYQIIAVQWFVWNLLKKIIRVEIVIFNT